MDLINSLETAFETKQGSVFKPSVEFAVVGTPVGITLSENNLKHQNIKNNFQNKVKKCVRYIIITYKEKNNLSGEES